MEDLSEEAIIKNCPFCNIASQAYHYPLSETNNFRIVSDGHPLEEGHILVIPKIHINCIGEYDEDLFNEFTKINNEVCEFVKSTYGTLATFEHGIFGQTVFHSHVHYLPFSGSSLDIVPEGGELCEKLESLSELKSFYKEEGGYLYFSIEDKMWKVDVKLTEPRFFRDRFAIALGTPERGNWKEMHQNPLLMEISDTENKNVQKLWQEYEKSE